MPADDPSADVPRHDRIIELIAAVAVGDAARADVVAALRDEGVDALDVVIAVVEQAAKSGASAHARHSRVIDPYLVTTTPAGARAGIVHREPALPFLLRGTLYDPKDIERFQGEELHFIPSAGRDHILVIDDRETMRSWWQLSYLSSGTASAPALPPFPPLEPGIPPTFPPAPPFTQFYEDVNNAGEIIELKANRGYADLTQVGFGFLGSDDWNDKISSFRNFGTRITVLHDDIHWGGSTFSGSSDTDLRTYGWNDRASSVETW